VHLIQRTGLWKCRCCVSKNIFCFLFVSDTLTLPISFFLPGVRSDQKFCHSRRKSEEDNNPFPEERNRVSKAKSKQRVHILVWKLGQEAELPGSLKPHSSESLDESVFWPITVPSGWLGLWPQNPDNLMVSHSWSRQLRVPASLASSCHPQIVRAVAVASGWQGTHLKAPRGSGAFVGWASENPQVFQMSREPQCVVPKAKSFLGCAWEFWGLRHGPQSPSWWPVCKWLLCCHLFCYWNKKNTQVSVKEKRQAENSLTQLRNETNLGVRFLLWGPFPCSDGLGRNAPKIKH